MKLFTSPAGSGSLWFANITANDGTPVAYDPQTRTFRATPPFCANRDAIGCNWVAPKPDDLCESCAMTALAPDLSIDHVLANWAKSEAAKRWVLDNLGRWGWFRSEDAGPHPVFHMLAEGATPVTMGHSEGVVTISVAEADAVVRVGRREALDEPYRTMIGHIRHEIAHMLWWRLSLCDDFLDSFRSTFGDERADYGDALQRHYTAGPPADWNQRFLTAYASAHPHEDWAETAAHLLHLTDITDSLIAAGLSAPELPDAGWDPYSEPDTARLILVATSLTVAVNHVNRSMGLADLYPFVLSDAARSKFAFAHHWLRRGPNALLQDPLSANQRPD